MEYEGKGCFNSLWMEFDLSSGFNPLWQNYFLHTQLSILSLYSDLKALVVCWTRVLWEVSITSDYYNLPVVLKDIWRSLLTFYSTTATRQIPQHKANATPTFSTVIATLYAFIFLKHKITRSQFVSFLSASFWAADMTHLVPALPWKPSSGRTLWGFFYCGATVAS